MTITTQQDQLFRETVFPSNAARQVQPIVQNLLNQRECLLRYDPPDADSQVAAALEWFETYADAANRKPQKWIDRPYISATERLPGIWRLVTVRTASEEGEDPGIYLLLREGWATTLLQSEARFMSVQGSYATGSLSFTRYWPNIDPSKVVGLAATLNATATVTNPVMNGVEQSGTFAVSGVTGQIMDGDGAGVVSQVLTQITALAATDDTSAEIGAALAARRYLKTRDNEILQPFDFHTSEGDGIALVFTNMSLGDETKCMETVTDAQLVASLATGFTYLTRAWKNEANGTSTFTIAFRAIVHPSWDIVKPTPSSISYRGKDTSKESKSTSWDTVRKADLALATSDLLAPESGFVVDTITASNKGDGSISMTQVQVKKIKSTDASIVGEADIEVVQPFNFVSGTRYRITIINENLDATAEGLITMPSETYSRVKCWSKLQDNGKWSVYAVFEYIVWPSFSFEGHNLLHETFPEGIEASSAPVTIRVKTWLNVPKAEMDSAKNTLWTTKDANFLVDDVIPKNNGDGSVDLVQETSKVDTEWSREWSLASGVYWVVYTSTDEDGKTTVIGRVRYDNMWDYERKYFISEQAAHAWINSGTQSSYSGSQVHRITTTAWRAVRQTKGTDKISDWNEEE